MLLAARAAERPGDIPTQSVGTRSFGPSLDIAIVLRIDLGALRPGPIAAKLLFRTADLPETARNGQQAGDEAPR
jgi:hypothetical protein